MRSDEEPNLNGIVHQKFLQQAERLFQQGKFREALEELDRMETQENILEIVRLQSQLLQCRIYTFWDIQKAQDLATQVIQTSQNQNQLVIEADALLIMAEAWLHWGMLDSSKTFVDQGKARLATISTITSAERTKHEAMLLALAGGIDALKGEYNRAIEGLQQSLLLREQQNDSLAAAQSLAYLGDAHLFQGEYQRALECYKQSLTLYEQLGHPPAIAWSLNNLGIFYEEQGELERALDYLQKSLAICESVGWHPMIAHVSNWLGCVYMRLGELNQAIELFQTSLGIFKQLGMPGTLIEAKSWQFLGIVYTLKGELDPALEYLEQSLVIYQEQGDKEEIGFTLYEFGWTYLKKGQLEVAFEYLGQGFRIYEDLGNEQYIMSTLFALMIIALEQNQPETARHYLQRIEEYREKRPCRVTEYIYNMAWALLLKASPRTRDKMRAQDLFRQLAEEKIVHIDLTVLASLNLCELLFFEFKTSEDPEILHEIHTVTNHLLDLAQTQHAYPVLAETYVLQAKLALVELDVPRARQLLTQAQAIADDKGLEKLARSISHEHDKLLGQLRQWEVLRAQKAVPAETRELSDIEDLFARMIRHRAPEPPALPPEEPVLLLVLTESGLSIFTQKFALGQQLDAHLIGGLVTAINTFGQDVFAGSVTNRIMYEEFTVVLKALDGFLFCYIFQGQSYLALQKLEQFINRVRESTTLWQTLNTATRTNSARKAVTESEGLYHLIQEIFQP